MHYGFSNFQNNLHRYLLFFYIIYESLCIELYLRHMFLLDFIVTKFILYYYDIFIHSMFIISKQSPVYIINHSVPVLYVYLFDFVISIVLSSIQFTNMHLFPMCLKVKCVLFWKCHIQESTECIFVRWLEMNISRYFSMALIN